MDTLIQYLRSIQPNYLYFNYNSSHGRPGKETQGDEKSLFLFREVKGSVKVQKDLEYLCTVLLNRNELEIEQAVMLHEK